MIEFNGEIIFYTAVSIITLMIIVGICEIMNKDMLSGDTPPYLIEKVNGKLYRRVALSFTDETRAGIADGWGLALEVQLTDTQITPHDLEQLAVVLINSGACLIDDVCRQIEIEWKEGEVKYKMPFLFGDFVWTSVPLDP